jgi:hypothetical protein
MRHFSTYRGFRRNIARIAGIISGWRDQPLRTITHRVKRWVDEKNDKGIRVRVNRLVERYQVFHDSFRLAVEATRTKPA